MKTIPAILALLLVAGPLFAQVKNSADYSISTDTLDSGGGRSSSADYRMDTSIGLIVGVSSAGSPVETNKVGYIAQLTDVTALQLSATSMTINEGGTGQLAATHVLDDTSTTPLPSSSLTWAVQNGPVTSINSSGIATAGLVYQNTAATVSGSFGGLTGTLGLTVINTNIDNYPGYAGDNFDDACQVIYFGPNDPNSVPTKDPDGDGQDNLFECTAGTIPTNRASRFILYPPIVQALLTQKLVRFEPAFTDRTYVIEWSTDLKNWFDLGSPLTGISGTYDFLDSSAGGPWKFYRVRISWL